MNKNLYINDNECVQCGQCVEIAPEFFDIDDTAAFTKKTITEQDENNELLKQAIQECPQLCIHWKQKDSDVELPLEIKLPVQDISIERGLVYLKKLGKNCLLKEMKDPDSGIWYNHEEDIFLLHPYIPYGVNSIEFYHSLEDPEPKYEIIEYDLTHTYRSHKEKVMVFDDLDPNNL